jgi:hypothetical protein
VNLRLLPRRCLYRFLHRGEWRELRDPTGPPTGRQLLRLNHSGALALVEPGQVEPISKGEAAYALDVLGREEAA